MKIGVVYTVTKLDMCRCIDGKLREVFDEDMELRSYSDPTILQEVMAAGEVVPSAARRLMKMYLQAMDDGCQAILNVCSSVGDVADAMASLNPYTHIPVVRMDDDMCRRAAELRGRLAVVATFPTALDPTLRKIEFYAQKSGRHMDSVNICIPNGFDSDDLAEIICTNVLAQAPDAGAVVLCQASMAAAAHSIQAMLEIPVLVSLDYGIMDLKRSLEAGRGFAD